MSTPYALINDGKRSLSWYREGLVMGGRANQKFDRVNAHLGLGGMGKPGELIIVGDDSTEMCTRDEEMLMFHARNVHQTLLGSNNASAHLQTHNYDLLQSIMTYGSIGVGSATSAWATHLNQVQDTLKDIGTAYQKWRFGVFTKDQFLAQRKALFSTLDGQLRGIGRWGTGLKNNSSIKKMLGISSKRYLHTGEIANYAKNVKRMGNVARHLSSGTVVGVMLDLGAGGLEIKEACTTGREQQCTKAKFVEVGKMVGGISSAAMMGKAGEKALTRLCIRMVGPSRGTSLLVCGVAGAASGGWVGGKGGSTLGDVSGTMLYELIGDE
ncbi:hypothetical protein ACIQAL_17460 [Pseudomonas sp. NPDC088368]|jgi:hypothetical protein|uniref:hypothetical protein n=1 Tax=Pseudomonas sp. NPDC088368 TaxID=3364453 RepID=UPI00381C2FE2